MPRLQIEDDFLFYLLMDLYLCSRWLYLAWVCRKSDWLGYFLMGLGALNWGIADFIEGMGFASRMSLESGTWIDWLWYTPFIFIFLALQINVSNSQQASSQSFSRSHLLNSPIFFIMMSLITAHLIENNESLFAPLSATQHTILNVWLSINISLAILQLFSLISRLKHKPNRRNMT